MDFEATMCPSFKSTRIFGLKFKNAFQVQEDTLDSGSNNFMPCRRLLRVCWTAQYSVSPDNMTIHDTGIAYDHDDHRKFEHID